MTAPTPPAEVESLLVEASTGGADAVDRFCAALLSANVGWLVKPDESGALAPITVPHPAGELVPFFSSDQKLREAIDTLQRLDLQPKVLPCRELWRMAVHNGAGTVLNPFSRYGKNFTAAEMSDLLAGIRPGTQTREVAAETRLQVGAPASVPDGLTPALADHLAALPGPVQRATLAWVQYPDGLQGYLLVIVTDLPRERVVDGLEAAAEHTGAATLDVVVQTPVEDDDLAAGVEPFWPS